MDFLYPVLATLLAFLIGSLSFAVIVSKALSLPDPRTFGSKNAGATNVLRSGSKKAAVVTLVLDALKGFIPVALVSHFGERFGMGSTTLAAVALAVFAGHVWPVFFGFKGGKGVATAAGVLFGVHWALGLMVLASFGLIFYFSRYVSLASMTAAAFAPVAYMMADRIWWYMSKSVWMALAVMAVLLIIKHYANINRLLEGIEPKFGAEAEGSVAKAKRK